MIKIHNFTCEEFLNRFGIINNVTDIKEDEMLKKFEHSYGDDFSSDYDGLVINAVILLSPIINEAIFLNRSFTYDEYDAYCGDAVCFDKKLERNSKKLTIRKTYLGLLHEDAEDNPLTKKVISSIKKIYGIDYFNSIYGVHIVKMPLGDDTLFYREANYEKLSNTEQYTLCSRIFIEHNNIDKYIFITNVEHSLMFKDKNYDFKCKGFFKYETKII